MNFAVVFFVNSAANFAIGLTLSALLGPAEFGRYATAMLAAMTLATALFDWLRLSSQRFSGDVEGRARIAASLDLAFLAMMALAVLAVVTAGLAGLRFGFGPYRRADAVRRDRQCALRLLWRAIAGARAGGRLRRALRDAPDADLHRSSSPSRCRRATPPPSLRRWRWRASRPPSCWARRCAPLARRCRRRAASGCRQFVVYAKPIVASTVIYQLIGLINRQTALDLVRRGGDRQAVARDRSRTAAVSRRQRPAGDPAVSSIALKRDREDGREAARRQIGVNSVIVFAILAPAHRGLYGDGADLRGARRAGRLSWRFRAPRASNWRRASSPIARSIRRSIPVFQLAQRTWPLTLAAVVALAADVVDAALAAFTRDVDGLAARLCREPRRRLFRGGDPGISRARIAPRAARSSHHRRSYGGDDRHDRSAQWRWLRRSWLRRIALIVGAAVFRRGADGVRRSGIEDGGSGAPRRTTPRLCVRSATQLLSVTPARGLPRPLRCAPHS